MYVCIYIYICIYLYICCTVLHYMYICMHVYICCTVLHSTALHRGALYCSVLFVVVPLIDSLTNYWCSRKSVQDIVKPDSPLANAFTF